MLMFMPPAVTVEVRSLYEAVVGCFGIISNGLSKISRVGLNEAVVIQKTGKRCRNTPSQRKPAMVSSRSRTGNRRRPTRAIMGTWSSSTEVFEHVGRDCHSEAKRGGGAAH